MARIVLVDDHEVVRSGVKTMLERESAFQICGVAGNGQEAIDLVLELRPDLVIMDLSMPGVNGFQAATKIRQLAPRVKILILSIHDAPLMQEIASLMGADAYLTKGVTTQKLVSTINAVLEQNVPPLLGSSF